MKHIYFIILLISNIFADDYIMLKDGISGSVSFIDTSGKHIIYIRDDKKRRIKKDKVEFIVINTDTIKYKKSTVINKPNYEKEFNKLVAKKTYTIEYKVNKTNDIALKNIVAINNIKVLQQKRKKLFKTLGFIQIGGSVVNQLIVFFDAKKTYKIFLADDTEDSRDNESIKLQNRWTMGHTMLSILNGLVFINGFIMVKIPF